MYPTDLLRCFVTIVDRDGFSQAGKVLGKSQPAVSLQIKRLEALVGSRLFVHSGRDLALTDSGKLVLEYGRKILELNQELKHRLRESQLKGRVRLGIPNEFAVSYLPQVLAGFSKRYPDVRLEVVSSLSRDLLRSQREQDLDIVIALSADGIDSVEEGQPAQQVMWSEDLVWVTGVEQLFSDTRALPLVVAPEGCVYRERMLHTLDASKKAWDIVYTGSSYGGIRAAVMAGLGVTALARSTVPKGLKIIKQTSYLPALQNAPVSIHYLSARPSKVVQRLAQFILESVV